MCVWHLNDQSIVWYISINLIPFLAIKTLNKFVWNIKIRHLTQILGERGLGKLSKKWKVVADYAISLPSIESTCLWIMMITNCKFQNVGLNSVKGHRSYIWKFCLGWVWSLSKVLSVTKSCLEMRWAYIQKGILFSITA